MTLDIQSIRSQIPTQCKIIAVSKKQSLESIQTLYDQGQCDFAENYSQELIEKQFHFKELPNIRWHFIGSIQKNKLKHLVGNVDYIHSVGSFDVAEAIDQIAKKRSSIQKILLQLNLAHEPTKSGWTEVTLMNSLDMLTELKNIEICGLMTLPPLFDDPEALRPYFKHLRELRDQLEKKIPSCTELSMGTSGDYPIAAQEGATMLRLGTIIFGQRPK